MNHNIEQTFLMLKPDCVKRKLTGEIISKFEKKGLNLISMKKVTPSREILEQHYIQHSEKPFFEELISFMLTGDVVIMVWSGTDVINVSREMIERIRGDYAPTRRQNLIHGSDSIESAEREIKIWF